MAPKDLTGNELCMPILSLEASLTLGHLYLNYNIHWIYLLETQYLYTKIDYNYAKENGMIWDGEITFRGNEPCSDQSVSTNLGSLEICDMIEHFCDNPNLKFTDIPESETDNFKVILKEAFLILLNSNATDELNSIFREAVYAAKKEQSFNTKTFC